MHQSSQPCTLHLPYRRHIYRTLADSVNPQQLICLVIVDRGDLAASQTEGDRRQGEILRAVARVKVNVAVGALFVFPLGALKYGGPYEDCIGGIRHLLIQRRPRHLERKSSFSSPSSWCVSTA